MNSFDIERIYYLAMDFTNAVSGDVQSQVIRKNNFLHENSIKKTTKVIIDQDSGLMTGRQHCGHIQLTNLQSGLVIFK